MVLGGDQTLRYALGERADIGIQYTLVPEPHNQERYDLFIGEVTAAWADSRVFADGHWTYDAETPAELQTLHYVAGGTFLSIDSVFSVTATNNDAAM